MASASPIPRGADHRHCELLAIFVLGPTVLATTVFGQSRQPLGPVPNRAFMAAPGEARSQPMSGPTVVSMAPGTTRTIEVWLKAGHQDALIAGYQAIFRDFAQPQAGATGSVIYVDDDPAVDGPDSIVLDTTRNDWLFAGTDIVAPVYGEFPASTLFGVIYSALPGDEVDPFTLAQPIYLGAFEIAASTDACGDHLFVWNTLENGGTPPLPAFFAPVAAEYPIDELQDLLVHVGCDCTVDADCDDADPCTVDSCVAGACLNNNVSGQPCTDDADCAATTDRTCIQGECVCPAQNFAFLDAVGGAGASRPATGSTMIVMVPGETRRIEAWLNTNIANAVDLNATQLVWQEVALPQPGATGTVSYVDNDPGGVPGDSILIDQDRADWAFASVPIPIPPVYDEAIEAIDGSVLMSVNYFNPFDEDNVDTFVLPQPMYLAEFDIEASADACGDHLFRWNWSGTGVPPLSALFGAGGATYNVTYQDVLVRLPCSCETVADCADLNGDGLRDDPCTYWACVDNTCAPTAVGFGDMGGQFGACEVDGATDGNDFFQALNCFANLDINGNPGVYPCEPHPAYPPTAFNVDAVGQFSSCVTDGVCDGNDALAALDAFNGNPACSCPEDGGPAPTFDGPIEVVEHAAITLRGARKRIRPGTTVAVDVLLDRPLADLRGYQLHVAAEGGHRGALELIDISVAGAVFAGRAAWDAYNVSTWQMVAGLYDRGMATPAGAYLATFTFAASKDAAGTFVVDLLHDDSDRTQRTFLFPTGPRAQIEVTSTRPALVEVGPARTR